MPNASCKLLLWLAASGLGVCASVASAQIAFTDVTAASGVSHMSETYGASLGDLNGDGYLDIFASNHRTQPSLFLNMGDGTFFDTGPQVLTWQQPPERRHARRSPGGLRQRRRPGPARQSPAPATSASCWSTNTAGWSTEPLSAAWASPNLGGRLPVWLDYDGDTA